MSMPCHCTHLRIATRKIAALYDAALAPAGISIAQFALLRHVARLQPISLTELGDALELDRSTMGRNVRVVEKLGLVAMGRGKDQREAVVRLTAEGAKVLRTATPLWTACQDDIAARIGPERLAALREIDALL